MDPKTTWGVGDYPLMARALEPASRETVELAGVVRTGRWKALHEDLAAFAESRSDKSDDHIVLHLDYLVAVANRGQ